MAVICVCEEGDLLIRKMMRFGTVLSLLLLFAMTIPAHATDDSDGVNYVAQGDDVSFEDEETRDDDAEHYVVQYPVEFVGVVKNFEQNSAQIDIRNPFTSEDFSFSLEEIFANDFDLPSFQVGDFVNVTYNPQNRQLVSLYMGQYWEFPNATDFTLYENLHEIRVAGSRLDYPPGLIVMYSGEFLAIDEIQNATALWMRGVDSGTVLFIEIIERVNNEALGGRLRINSPPEASISISERFDAFTDFDNHEDIDFQLIDSDQFIYLEFGGYWLSVEMQGYETSMQWIYFEYDDQVIYIEPLIYQYVATAQPPADSLVDVSIGIVLFIGLLVLLCIIALITMKILISHHLRTGWTPKQRSRKSERPRRSETSKSKAEPALHSDNVVIAVEGLKTRNDKKSRVYDFKVNKGDMVYVVGESGSGKTVLLKILGGYDKDVEGTLSFGGQNWEKNEKELKKRIGYVPQLDSLPLNTTPNKLLNHYHWILLGGEKEHKGSQILSDLGLSSKADEQIESLSGGERKRVSIAIELLREPDILILDEPDSGLDAVNRAKLQNALRKINTTMETTIISSTHYWDDRDSDGHRKMGDIYSSETPEENKKINMWKSRLCHTNGTLTHNFDFSDLYSVWDNDDFLQSQDSEEGG